MVEELFFWRGSCSSKSNPLEQFQNNSNLLILLLSGPPSSGKTSLVFQFAFNVASSSLHSNSSYPNVVFICNRNRLDSKPPFLSQGIDPSSNVFQRIQMKYMNDDEDIRKYFAAFHLYDTLPDAVVIDDFGDFFDNKVCQQRYANHRGRDLAMIKSLALCHNAINYANQKGSCKLLLSDTHTHQGDSPRFHFIYKKWIHTTFTIKEDDISGSFILKGKSYSQTDNTGTSSIKAAKYSIALQYLVFDGLVNDQVE
ncbi:tRNA dimethylallyltransferase [Trifolium repens]|nr:tRNA dimethylallyltransferase [Trifolium repens]